jgi:hypothetical protein
MQLIDNAEKIWKRWSIWIMASQVAVLATWGVLVAANLQPPVPDWLKWLVMIVLSAAAITVAPIKQGGSTPPKDGA